MSAERVPVDAAVETGGAEKVCRGCGRLRPIDEYAREPRTRSGRSARCRACRTAGHAAWRERAGEEARSRDAERCARYRREHAEERREKRARFYAEHREEEIERGRKRYRRLRDDAEWARLSRPGAMKRIVGERGKWAQLVDLNARRLRRMNALRVEVIYDGGVTGRVAAVDRPTAEAALRVGREIVARCDRDIAAFDRLRRERAQHDQYGRPQETRAMARRRNEGQTMTDEETR